MQRDELIKKVDHPDKIADGDYECGECGCYSPVTSMDATLRAIAKHLDRLAADDDSVGVHAEAHGVRRAAAYVRSLLPESEDQ